MDKKFLRECLLREVYANYKREELTLLEKVYCRYVKPETNAVWLLRRMQYYDERGGLYRLWAKYLQIKAVRRYGMEISFGAKIGLGLRIVHPIGIHVACARIGENFTIYQNCTVGAKDYGLNQPDKVAQIGNNVTMYAGSMIIGKVKVTEDVKIAANACMIHDALESGVYAGIPARKVK